MPAYSTLRTFVNALRSGRTNITETLDSLMANPARHKLHGDYRQLVQPDALKAPLAEWARRILSAPPGGGPHMSAAEISHLDIWPDDKKEEVRLLIVAAIDSNRPMRFFWELYDGDIPDNAISQAEDATLVRFRSPALGVRLSHVNIGAIHIDA